MKISLSTDLFLKKYKEKIKKEHLPKESFYNEIFEYLYKKYTGKEIKLNSKKEVVHVQGSYFYYKITILEKFWINNDWFLFNEMSNERIVENFIEYLKYDLELEVI